MNRSRLIRRDVVSEGSQPAQAAGLALAQIADRELLESLIHHISALREFGGELYIGAARARFKDGIEVDHGGEYLTHAYVVGYTEKSRIKNVPDEPDEPFVSVEPEYDPVPYEETFEATDDPEPDEEP